MNKPLDREKVLQFANDCLTTSRVCNDSETGKTFGFLGAQLIAEIGVGVFDAEPNTFEQSEANALRLKLEAARARIKELEALNALEQRVIAAAVLAFDPCEFVNCIEHGQRRHALAEAVGQLLAVDEDADEKETEPARRFGVFFHCNFREIRSQDRDTSPTFDSFEVAERAAKNSVSHPDLHYYVRELRADEV